MSSRIGIIQYNMIWLIGAPFRNYGRCSIFGRFFKLGLPFERVSAPLKGFEIDIRQVKS